MSDFLVIVIAALLAGTAGYAAAKLVFRTRKISDTDAPFCDVCFSPVLETEPHSPHEVDCPRRTDVPHQSDDTVTSCQCDRTTHADCCDECRGSPDPPGAVL